MAGLGYKNFADGNVLTGAELDGYLMEQSVMRFASVAARDTALSGVLSDGLMAYTTDTNTLWIRRAAAWRVFGVFFAPQVRYKTADTTRSNTTALSDDPDLVFAGLDAGTYVFDARLIYSATAVADWKGFLTATGSISNRLATSLRSNGGVLAYDLHDGAVAFTADGAGAGTKRCIDLTGSFVASADAQAYNLQWAQNTAEVSNCVLHLGSYFRIQRVA